MQSFGHYQILDRLGAGTLGELYRARDTRSGRTVALRLVADRLAADVSEREALMEAARNAMSWSHPHVAALFDAGEHDGRLFLASEYVPGSLLEALFQGRPFEARVAIDLIAQLADALSAAAAQNVVHGALSPSCIIITPADQAKILDFGFARWTETGRARRVASHSLNSRVKVSEQTLRGFSGHADSGVSYMSPEQALDEAVDPRSDIFSLGAIAHHLLTGRAPFAGGSPEGTALKIVQAMPLAPSQLNPALPPAADAIVGRMLAKSLDLRYGSAAEATSDLRALNSSLAPVRTLATSDATPLAPPPGGAYGKGTGRRKRRRRRRAAIGLAVAALCLLALAGFIWRKEIRAFVQGVPPTPVRPVLIVRPFDVAGPQAAPYYGMGFADDLAARLSEIPSLSVVGRALIHEVDNPARQEVLNPFPSAFTLKGTVKPGPYAIGLDLQLLDASGAQVWSRSYRRDPGQVLALQAEIGREVAARFQLEVPTGTRWARGMNRLVVPAAYDLYLQGRDASERRDRSRAIAAYQQALALDGRLVEARAQLSLALYLEEFYSGITGDVATRESAMREAQAAIAVDPGLAAAQVASALASPNMVGAASALSRALAIDASNGEAWHHAGDLVSETDPARALAYYRASLAFEPAIDANYRDQAAALSELGRYQDAESAVVRGEVARPSRPWWRQMRARLALEQQNPAAALALLATDSATESSPGVWLIGRIVPLMTTGRAADARAELLRLEQRYPSSCEARAIQAGVDLSLGDSTQAQATAEALYAEASRPNALPSLKACAAMAAAAVKSSADAAGWLAKVAEDDRALRAWTRQSIFGIGMSYRRGWYPWYNVNSSGPVREADAQLRAALERVQREVVRRLPAPPSPEHGGE